MAARTAVVTIVHGRHDHLRGQALGLARQTRPAEDYVVVTMADAEAVAVARESHPGALGVDLDARPPDLPLAAARNAGARAALDAGADVLIFLDVDCIPSQGTIARYTDVLTGQRGDRPAVACGEVRYLPPVAHPSLYPHDELADLARPHPARPAPSDEQVVPSGAVGLFWSLSFAVSARDWHRLGGFAEDYVGYGAEDTDFGQRLAVANGTLLWVGGAVAFHQHHDSETPPTRHLQAIVRNANIFRDRWGWFPMGGWLAAFAERGLAELDPATDRWRVI